MGMNPQDGFKLGGWVAYPLRDILVGPDGEVHIEPKVMQVLEYLAENQGGVVERDKLLEDLWDGRAIADEPLTRCIASLRQALGDSPKDPQYIQTIPKRGYRLVCPIEPLDAAPDVLLKKHHRKIVIAAIAVVTAVWFAMDLSTTDQDSEAPQLGVTGEVVSDPSVVSIAVLPFLNLSADPEQSYFSDGISEDILNLLTGVDGLRVISRASAFSFRDSNLPIPAIARELGVAHIMVGSIRRQATQIRITVQLVDATTDAIIWSDSFDRELSDIFAVQREIAESVAAAMTGTLGVNAIKAEAPTSDIRAYQLFLQGRQSFYQRGPSLDDAIDALQGATNRDPEFADAWAFLAAAAQVTWGYDTKITNESAQALADSASQKALDIDPDSGLALAVRSLMEHDQRELIEAAELIGRAVEVDPRNSTIRLWAGQFNFHYGYIGEALVHLEKAYELDPLVGIINGALGMAYLSSGQDSIGLTHLDKAESLAFFHHAATRFNHLVYSQDLERALSYRSRFDSVAMDEVSDQTRFMIAKALRTGDSSAIDALVAKGHAIHELPGHWEMNMYVVLNLGDRYFDRLSQTIALTPYWRMAMRFMWLPGNRKYLEEPRFFSIMNDAGVVGLWQQRGYPDGCNRVDEPAGPRLDCTERFK